MRHKHSFRQRLQQGEPVIGTWSVLPSASVTNVLAAAGFDFLILDLEHGPASIQAVEDMVRAAVRSIKYHPAGNRGMSPYTRSGGYAPGDPARWTQEANRRTVCVVIVEGKEGLDNLDEICGVPGIDVVYLGIYDISQALGHPGEIRHPEVTARVNNCVRQIEDKGIAAGCLVQTNDDLQNFSALGFRFLAYAADCALLLESCRGVVDSFQKICSVPQRKPRHEAAAF